MEADLLLRIHALSSPALDVAARIGWLLGVTGFCVPAVLAAVAWHLSRGERREALAWLAVGVATALLPEIVKAAVARARPTLWPWLLPTSGYAFPSGHAVAGAALYPLVGWLVLRSRGRGTLGYGAGLAVGVLIGLTRLYAGVHWPTDVLAGWSLGAALSLGAVRWLGEPAARGRAANGRRHGSSAP